jgi:Domain of unknown function (DUF4304)
MDQKQLKALISTVAEENGFASAHGGWFMASNECIVVLELQKSKFGNYCDANLKFFVQGAFGNRYVESKDLVKVKTGDVFVRAPQHYRKWLDLDAPLDQAEREQGLVSLFEDCLTPIAKEGQTRAGLLRLERAGKVHLLPAVRAELEKALGAPASRK